MTGKRLVRLILTYKLDLQKKKEPLLCIMG